MNLPKNSKTSPVANLAPANLARIKPCLDFNLNIFTFDGNFFCMYLVSFPLKCFLSLKSSTKIISCNIDSVVVSRTLHTVLKYNLSYIILEVSMHLTATFFGHIIHFFFKNSHLIFSGYK